MASKNTKKKDHKKDSGNNDLKKLSRLELLELLLEQTKRADALERTLAETRTQLENKQLDIDEAGSIAEASLRLNGVFSTAQDAAHEYLENIRQLSDRQKSVCAGIEADAQKKAEAMLEEAQAECDRMLEEAEKTRAEAEQILRQAKDKAQQDYDPYWAALSRRMETFFSKNPGVHESLQAASEQDAWVKPAKDPSEWFDPTNL